MGDERFVLDAALPALRLAFEIDGFGFHSSKPTFERDRRKDMALARIGWWLVRMSAAQVLYEPEDTRTATADIIRRASKAA